MTPQPLPLPASPDLPPLAVGDLSPSLALPDQDGKLRELQNYGGRKTVLFFLPVDDRAYLDAFFAEIKTHELRLSNLDFHRVYILHAGSERLKALRTELGITSLFWADESGQVARAFGIFSPAQSPVSFQLDENMKIVALFREPTAPAQLGALMDSVQAVAKRQPPVFSKESAHAPVLVIPDAISPELCAALLEAWRQGQKMEGTIGVDGQEKVNTQGKRRTDVDFRDRNLLMRIDAEMCKRVFPELRKVACLDVRYRERYKSGRYGHEDQGFYNQHRDTGVPVLSYRRYSMSVGLSSDYEGGLLEFTEYGNAGYRLSAGTAVLFPSTLLHRISPVTKGERFVMVSFFHGEAEEQARKRFAESQGRTYTPSEKILCESYFPGITESPGLYTNSLRA